MIQTPFLTSIALAALVLSTPAAMAQSKPVKHAQRQAATPPGGGEGQPSLLGQYGDWGAYAGNSGGRKVCFALAKPASAQTNPPNRPRDPIYMFVSTRPAENVRNEVSVIVGYSFKPNSEATLDIGGTKFALYTQADGAWVKNSSDEGRLIDSMRKSGDVVVKGVSGRGTETTDRYSLKGLAQALDRVGQECR
jgi:Invasion associated locus B (IalB) protein